MPVESKKTDSRPTGTKDGVKGGAGEREQRLAAALRDNLRKRKAQQRDRTVADRAKAPGSGGGDRD